jgi:alginate O-acetyltransferase complex protein AlgJ
VLLVSVPLKTGEPDPEQTQPFIVHEAHLPSDHPSYRPRHAARQRLALVCSVIFFLGPLTGLAVFGRPPAIENRALHPFPSLSQGWGFFSGLVPWALDNLSFRNSAIQANDRISRNVFHEPPALGAGGTDAAPGGIQAPPQQAVVFPQAVEGTNGWLYYGEDMRAKCQPDASLDSVIQSVLRLKNDVEVSGRRFVLVVPPDKSTVEPQNLPAQYEGKDCAKKLSDAFWPRIVKEAGAIDLRGAIHAEEQKSGTSLYFPQDSHWTFAGGVLMTRTVADAIQPGVDSTWKVAKGQPYSGPADLPPLIGRTGVDNTDRLTLAPDGTTDRSYQIPFDARNVLTFQTPADVKGTVGGTTTWIGDSFTTWGTPSIAAAFQNVNIVQGAKLDSDPAAVAQMMVDSDTVVVEMVERGIAPGVSVEFEPKVMDTLTKAMTTHPRR